MELGIVFPQLDIGSRKAGVERFVRAVEAAGLSYLLAFDHVLGAGTSTRPDWRGAYSSADTFHEPFVLFGFVAGVTRLSIVTGVIVLPQRQTALVAKQAAELDILLDGRLRLGVGTGWNPVEYQGLGVSFADRGAIFDEQIELLRLLWTRDVVDFHGTYHTIEDAGIRPRPVQQPIPLWFGTPGGSRRVLERIGRTADGWMPTLQPNHGLEEARQVVDRAASDAGRDPESIALEGRIHVGKDPDLDEVRKSLESWAAQGASYVAFDALRHRLSVDDHLRVLDALAPLVGEDA